MRSINIPTVSLHAGVALTPISFVHSILLAYKKYGVLPDLALKTSMISVESLHAPDARITAGQMEMMSSIAMQELDDEALGWFTRKLPWGTYGMLCRASLTSTNLETAIQRWCRHHHLLTDNLLIELDVRDKVATLSIDENISLGDMRELCLLTTLRYVLGYASWIIDSTIDIKKISFPFNKPKHFDVYEQLFLGEVSFDMDRTSISFDSQYLKLQPRRDEQALNQMLKRALPLTVLRYQRDRLLVQKIKNILNLPENQVTNLELLAAKLNLSPRTLQRRLKDEDASLNTLLETTKREKAISLLLKSEKSIKQISLLVGYHNEKSFARAFKSWTGMSASEYRARKN